MNNALLFQWDKQSWKARPSLCPTDSCLKDSVRHSLIMFVHLFVDYTFSAHKIQCPMTSQVRMSDADRMPVPTPFLQVESLLSPYKNWDAGKLSELPQCHQGFKPGFVLTSLCSGDFTPHPKEWGDLSRQKLCPATPLLPLVDQSGSCLGLKQVMFPRVFRAETLRDPGGRNKGSEQKTAIASDSCSL